MAEREHCTPDAPTMKLYTELASWWPLVSRPEDYAEEAAHYWSLLCRHARHPIKTVLELGCGGGNNASFLKRDCALTLTDVSAEMLSVSRSANPECAHVEGDMRSLRLGRAFDAVFVHDAVMYMRTPEDLRRAIATARIHCRPGGAALFVPDCTRETWTPYTGHHGHDGSHRAIRYLEWQWDPDPADTEYVVDMVYVLREGDAVRVESERHVYGLFPQPSWVQWMEEAGFRTTVEPCPFPGGERTVTFTGVLPE